MMMASVDLQQNTRVSPTRTAKNAGLIAARQFAGKRSRPSDVACVTENLPKFRARNPSRSQR
jgi:hypothetical protein